MKLQTTECLFYCLLKRLNISCICDIGSMDGTASILFRKLRPEASIFAFEANKYNFGNIINDSNILNSNIKVVNCAVTNYNGTAKFNIVSAEYDDPHSNNRGRSSLYTRDDAKIKESVEVEAIRIDDFLLNQNNKTDSIALWVDVEGADYEVLKGIEKIKDRISIIHVEVEKKKIWNDQKVYTDVLKLMNKYNFEVIFTSLVNNNDDQGNAVFIKRDLLPLAKKCKRKVIVLSIIKAVFRPVIRYRIVSDYWEKRRGKIL